MKELLYIPSGKFVRFFSYTDGNLSPIPIVPFEQFVKSEEGQRATNGYGDVDFMLRKLRDRQYLEAIYEFAEIPKTGRLYSSEFELVEMDDAGYNVS
jgi:hypothetical protein